MTRIDKAQSAPSDQGGKQSSAGAAPKEAEANAAHRFSNLLSGRKGGESGSGQKGHDPASGPLPGPAELLARRPAASSEAGPLAGKHGSRNDPAGDAERLADAGALAGTGQTPAQRLDAGMTPLGPATATAGADKTDVDIIGDLADRILVAEPKAGENEVRIRLNLDTLQGTEIALKRDANGLNIAFETPSPEIAERLAVARQGLTERLQEKTGLDVTVDITHSEQDDKDRGGERNDGRSRNRFDYDPESGNNA